MILAFAAVVRVATSTNAKPKFLKFLNFIFYLCPPFSNLFFYPNHQLKINFLFFLKNARLHLSHPRTSLVTSGTWCWYLEIQEIKNEAVRNLLKKPARLSRCLQ